MTDIISHIKDFGNNLCKVLKVDTPKLAGASNSPKWAEEYLKALVRIVI